MSESNGYADKASILGANKRRFRDVDVPLIGKVRIRSLTERERSEYEAGFLDGSGNVSSLVDSKVRLIVLCVCNAEGHRLFTDEEATVLSDVDAVVTNTLADECRRLSGFSDEDVGKLEKNLE